MSSEALTVVMPAYNEGLGIGRAIDEVQTCAERLVGADLVAGVELVVVDDGSTDDTADRVREAVRREVAGDPARVRLVGHDRNRGLGAALRTGFAAARHELVFYTDADLPVDLSVIDRALDLMRLTDADVVTGYRRTRRGIGARRMAYSVGYNAMCRYLFDLRVRDVNFAAKLVRREVLDQVRLRSEGSFIDVELLARANALGCRIAQLPLDSRARESGASTLSSPAVVVGIVRELWRYGPEIRPDRPGLRSAR